MIKDNLIINLNCNSDNRDTKPTFLPIFTESTFFIFQKTPFLRLKANKNRWFGKSLAFFRHFSTNTFRIFAERHCQRNWLPCPFSRNNSTTRSVSGALTVSAIKSRTKISSTSCNAHILLASSSLLFVVV